MGLMPAYFNSHGKCRSKTTAKQRKSLEAHEEWVRSMTGGRKPDKRVAAKQWRESYAESMKVDRSDYVSAGLSGNASSCAKRGVMVNLHRESEQTRKEILDKASRVMPLYNKGGLQFLTPGEDIKTVGTKSRRG